MTTFTIIITGTESTLNKLHKDMLQNHPGFSSGGQHHHPSLFPRTRNTGGSMPQLGLSILAASPNPIP